MSFKEGWTLVKSAASSWIDDYAPSMGAALAYYTVFSIAPLLLIVISIAGLVFGQEAARGSIVTQLQGLMGEQAAGAVEGLLVSVSQPSKGILATLIGFIVLLIGATTVFGELQDALDRIWRAPARKTSGLWSLLRARVLSFGMILGVGFLLIASLVVSAGLSALGAWWAPAFGGWEVLAQVVNFAVSFGLVTVIFAMIYKIMPRVRIKWHDVWIGAGVTALLFTIGKFLIGLYVGKSGVTSGFGAAASLVVLLVWVYYSAQIFLLGAEFTWVYAHTFGSLKGQPIPGKTPAVPSVSSNPAPAPAAAAGTPGAAAAATDAAATDAVPVKPGAPQADAALVAAAAAKTPAKAPVASHLAPKPQAPLNEHAPLKERTAAFVRRDPVKGVGIAVVSGVALKVVMSSAIRLALKRLRRRSRRAA